MPSRGVCVVVRLCREGREVVLLGSAVTAVTTVFPDTVPPVSFDRVRLTQGALVS